MRRCGALRSRRPGGAARQSPFVALLAVGDVALSVARLHGCGGDDPPPPPHIMVKEIGRPDPAAWTISSHQLSDEIIGLFTWLCTRVEHSSDQSSGWARSGRPARTGLAAVEGPRSSRFD